MSRYFFNLKDRHGVVSDREGMDFDSEAEAFAHAGDVARELMRDREVDARAWRIEVLDAERRRCGEILFANVDETIAALDPATRLRVEETYARAAGLIDAVHRLQRTMEQLRGTLARANRATYLAAMDGVQL